MVTQLLQRKSYVRRRTIATVMTMIYLAIALSPLASLAMHSRVVAHAVTGECTGDCAICGCSLESRASNTCCCAKKKQMQSSAARLSSNECCTPPAASAPAVAKGNCCDASQQTEPVVAKNACCAKSDQHLNDEKLKKPEQEAPSPKSETVYKCGCPCGKSELPSLAGAGTSELLPYIYSESIVLPQEDTHYTLQPLCMVSRHAAPPDPPPKIFLPV